ncbi:unnamed protein product [Rhizophagus irregularis]|nr:unnamed protein product [Rhizophagus irregularis]
MALDVYFEGPGRQRMAPDSNFEGPGHQRMALNVNFEGPGRQIMAPDFYLCLTNVINVYFFDFLDPGCRRSALNVYFEGPGRQRMASDSYFEANVIKRSLFFFRSRTLKVKEAETSSGLPYRRQGNPKQARESETEFRTPILKIKEAENSDSHTKVFPYEGKTFARKSENEFWTSISKVKEAKNEFSLPYRRNTALWTLLNRISKVYGF